jgi:DNA-binding transcriptional ArsR family regulator
LELIQELADKILASGVIYQPLHLIADGDRLFPMDGHRRVLAWLLLASQEIIVPNVLAIIKPLASGLTVRDLEYQMLSYGTNSQKLSVYDKAKLIRRHLHEDTLEGLTEEQSCQQFCEKTGWKKSEYDRTLEISSMSSPTLKAIEGKVSETTLHNLVRKNELTLSEKENVLLETVAIAEEKGIKATGELVQSVASNLIESKNPTFLDSDGDVKPSDELEPKPIKLTPKAKDIKYLLMTLATEGNAKQTGDDTMTVDFPVTLWEKLIDFVERLS